MPTNNNNSMTTQGNAWVTRVSAAPCLAIPIPSHEIRGVYDDDPRVTIRVYQAYADPIADAALAHGRFAPPFSRNRMSWIKPSFLWMMYRAGWGFKDSGQCRILAIDIQRTGFDWALAHACLSHPDPSLSKAQWESHKAAHPVRIQWDPERDLHHHPLPHRSIQIGLSGEALARYVDEWTVNITEITPLAHRIQALVATGDLAQASALLPPERPYPTPANLPWAVVPRDEA